jgi:hypothetical protein
LASLSLDGVVLEKERRISAQIEQNAAAAAAALHTNSLSILVAALNPTFLMMMNAINKHIGMTVRLTFEYEIILEMKTCALLSRPANRRFKIHF